MPNWLGATLRLEWLCMAAAAVAAFAVSGGSWLLFALLVLAPDLFMLGYLPGPRIGALAYNLVHTLVGPAALATVSWAADSDILWHVALIWAFHIAVDRALGYGLKLPTGFGDTHLGRIGRDRE